MCKVETQMEWASTMGTDCGVCRATAAPCRQSCLLPEACSWQPTVRSSFLILAAEVLPVKSGLGGGDVTKRGGRWESDFIWNKVGCRRVDVGQGLITCVN